MKTNIRFTAVFGPANEGVYIGYVEEFADINTEGETLEEPKANLMNAMQDYFEPQRLLSQEELLYIRHFKLICNDSIIKYYEDKTH